MPESLPALLYARKVLRRAASTGFASPDVDARLAGLGDELDELGAELHRVGTPQPETEPDASVMEALGDVLFGVVTVASALNVDSELALRGASRRFMERVEGELA